MVFCFQGSVKTQAVQYSTQSSKQTQTSEAVPAEEPRSPPDPRGRKDKQVPSHDYPPNSQSPVSISTNHQFESERQIYSGLGLEKPELAPTGNSESDSSGAPQASTAAKGR